MSVSLGWVEKVIAEADPIKKPVSGAEAGANTCEKSSFPVRIFS
jgi:hypothetical protein